MSQQINLFNPQLLKQKELLDAARMAWLVGAAMLMMLAAYGWSSYRVSQLARTQQAVASQLATLQAQLKQLTQRLALRQPSKALENEIALAEAALKNREQVIAFLQGGGVGNAQGFSGYMRAFSRQSISGLWLTGFTINDAVSEIRISGRALRPELVPQYIAGLGQEPLLKGREFSTLSLDVLAQEPAKTATPVGADQKAPEPVRTIVEFKLQSVEKKMATGDSANVAEKKP